VHRVATTRFGRGRLIGRAIDYASFYASSAIALMRLVRRADVRRERKRAAAAQQCCSCGTDFMHPPDA